MIWFFLFIVLLCLSILLFLVVSILSKKNEYRLEQDISKNPCFAILIPARYESSVISDLLDSIKHQTRKIPMKDVYVIVESLEDPTVEICASFGASVVLRHHLERKSKGYALDEAIEFLKAKNKYYDAYFIFDADNILDKNYLLEMEQDYKSGYAISTGYRNYKNANESVVSAAAGIIYTFINEWINKKGLRYCKNIMLSGTGFYIHGKYIKEWGCYPFASLTEDVELSYYACLEAMSTHYNEKAIFYDEQPTSMHASILQRKRWVKGYFQNWLSNIPKLWSSLSYGSNQGSKVDMMVGILPIILIVFSYLYLVVYFLVHFFVSNFAVFDIIMVLFLLLALYLFLTFMTYLILRQEGNKLKMSKKMRARVIWFHPIFLFTYLYVVLLVIFQRDIGWDKIQHGKN